MNDFSLRLKLFRNNNKLSQEKLARIIGVSLMTVQRWECGKSNPSPLAKEKLNELLREPSGEHQLKLIK